MRLEPASLLEALRQFPAFSQIRTWWLAYSGGVDSQVLLHLFSQLKLNLQAVYIDHGLQQDSLQWADHCHQSCLDLGIPFQQISVNAHPQTGESPEAAARAARYQALAQLLGNDDCLLTAQHQDDQAETFMLQLLRGAGAAGLASMPFYNHFSRGWHLRPLLGFTRQDIVSYAEAHQLSWVEDPSNQLVHYDRNFLRHQVMPEIRQRWPSADRILANSAEQQAENSELLDQLASIDLQTLDVEPGSLAIEPLKHLADARQRNVLRYWIRENGHALPSRRVLRQIVQQAFSERVDADPEVHWAGSEIHRYRHRLYLISSSQHDVNQTYQWQGEALLLLDSLEQILSFRATCSEGLRADIADKSLTVRFRQGGEVIRPAGRDGTHRLKKLFQEAGVPSWLRSRVPLLYLDDELIAVVGYWIADQYSCEQGGKGIMPVLAPVKDGFEKENPPA